MTYCLVPLPTEDLQRLIGDGFIGKFQAEIDTIIQPLRKHIALGRPASMGKELWEYAVADSITNAKWCGAGKSIADVSIGLDIGIDVKSVQINKHATTEASMYQPLAELEAASQHFTNKSKQELWNLFVKGWLTKVSSIKEYYMLVIFRDSKTFDCSIAGFKINNNQVRFLEEDCEFISKSMKVNSIADPELVNIKVYSGKTRLEIRIKDKLFNDPKYTLPIYKF
jgi:hypothetical protein